MFLKLFKHEFKSQAGLFGILSGAALLAGGVGCFMTWLFSGKILETVTTSNSNLDDMSGIVMVAAMLLMIAAMFCVAAYSIAIFILQVVRFYKRHFSDEGYLTFTLPASSHEILLSSILNIVIWNLISAVVAVISLVMIFVPFMQLIYDLGTYYDGYFIGFDAIIDSMIEIDADMIGTIVLQIVQSVCTWFGGLMLPLVSMTIGSLIAKRGKLFVGFALCYGITMVISVIRGIFSALGSMGDYYLFMESQAGLSTELLSMLLPAVLYLVVGVGGYFLMHRLVDRKLNLP